MIFQACFVFRHDWGKWAGRILVFVNNPGANGTLHNNWSGWGVNNPPNCTTVDNDVTSTSTSKFIYYQ